MGEGVELVHLCVTYLLQSYKGSNDLQVHSREKMGMHPENAALAIHCNSKANEYLWGGNLDRQKRIQHNS